MSNSRSRDEMEVGVGESAERGRRILPFWLMNCSRSFGVKAGPSPEFRQSYMPAIALENVPFDLGGSRRTWSNALSPCWNKESLSFLGDSKVSL